jgi:hypothetical protein
MTFLLSVTVIAEKPPGPVCAATKERDCEIAVNATALDDIVGFSGALAGVGRYSPTPEHALHASTEIRTSSLRWRGEGRKKTNLHDLGESRRLQIKERARNRRFAR